MRRELRVYLCTYTKEEAEVFSRHFTTGISKCAFYKRIGEEELVGVIGEELFRMLEKEGELIITSEPIIRKLVGVEDIDPTSSYIVISY